jgi:hypothetical protein
LRAGWNPHERGGIDEAFRHATAAFIDQAPAGRVSLGSRPLS